MKQLSKYKLENFSSKTAMKFKFDIGNIWSIKNSFVYFSHFQMTEFFPFFEGLVYQILYQI